jgi:hypothetical protein
MYTAQDFIFTSELFEEMAEFVGWCPDELRNGCRRVIEKTGGEPKRIFKEMCERN